MALGFGPISATPISTLPTAAGGINATLNVTEADDTAASVSTLAISAALSITESGDTLVSSASLAISGSASIGEADDTLSATADLEIKANEGGLEADDTLSGAGTLQISASADISEAGDTLSATGIQEITGRLDASEDDDTVLFDSTLRLPQTGAWAPETPKHKRKSKRERERLLDQALAKAFDTKQTPIIDRMPWLAEPIPEAIRLEEPEFNPVLASLHGEMANLQTQLAQLQFNRAQEEDDIELLLMAL